MDIVAGLVPRPLSAANASPAALFRSIEKYSPTVLLDEFDAVMNMKTDNSEAVRTILNAGHRRGQYSGVLRCDERGIVHFFDVFGAKVVAGIGKVWPTVQDRAIVITLRRKLPSESVNRFRVGRLAEELSLYREQCELVADEIRAAIKGAEPISPESLSDRAADNWEMLFAIADVAGGPWPEMAREAACALARQSEEDSESHGTSLLERMRQWFEENSGQDFAPTQSILEHLNQYDDEAWASWNKGAGIKARDLSKNLGRFGIKPQQCSLRGEKIRGYRKAGFEDAWARYLDPPIEAEAPLPRGVNDIPDRELSRNEESNGSRRDPLPATPLDSSGFVGNGLSCYSLPRERKCKSIYQNQLIGSGNGVPGETVGQKSKDTGRSRLHWHWKTHDPDGMDGGFPLV